MTCRLRGASAAALIVAATSAAAQTDLSGAATALGTKRDASAPVVSDAVPAALAALESAWTSAPMSVRRAAFVTEKAPGYGVYAARSSDAFTPGEKLRIYFEPVGYVWKPVEAGQYTFGVSVDLAIKDAGGKTLFEKAQFARLPITSHEKNTEFMVNVDLGIDGLAPGRYAVELTLHDLNGPKTATLSLPFAMVNGT